MGQVRNFDSFLLVYAIDIIVFNGRQRNNRLKISSTQSTLPVFGGRFVSLFFIDYED